MPSPFGDHQLKIPYEPVADLLAKYARRDPAKTAIVDLESGTAIDFGQLDRIAIDIAAYLKSKGISKGSRVLVLSDECLEKLLIWFGVWRIGAVICPFNLEINEKQMVRPDRRAEACADPLSQGDRRCRDGRRRAGRARALRRVVGRRRERPAGRAVRGAAARRRRATARAKRCRRHRLHLLHLRHHGAAEDRHLQPRRLLDERPRHPGIPRPDRRRPHPGIPLVRLELGAGVEPAAVPAEGADHAHRQAVLA